MKKIILDCRTAGYKTEKSDCTVGALAMAAKLPYDTAYKIMEDSGRKPGRGATMIEGILTARDRGLLRFDRIVLPLRERLFNGAPGFVGFNNRRILVSKFVGPTIKEFIATHPRGRYILRINKHALALIDGVMYDRFKQHAGAIVLHAWKIEPIARKLV